MATLPRTLSQSCMVGKGGEPSRTMISSMPPLASHHSCREGKGDEPSHILQLVPLCSVSHLRGKVREHAEWSAEGLCGHHIQCKFNTRSTFQD